MAYYIQILEPDGTEIYHSNLLPERTALYMAADLRLEYPNKKVVVVEEDIEDGN